MKFTPSFFKFKTRTKYPVILPSGNHPMERRLIERGVLDILHRLRKNGYQSYLVGGCVRDILLGMTPKDFDIVTDAHPRQIKRLFSRCYLIGKRFRLAHVYITADRFIEVATFRAAVDPEASESKAFQNNNTFGSIEEDVLRRDFTVNALYFNSYDSSIVDYTGGLDDIKKKVLRSIGDPAVRFREDPVRIIRAARFSARFGFRLSKKDYREALAGAGLIADANANRLLEELYKILKCGASSGSIVNLHRFGVLKYWLPELESKGLSRELTERLSAVDRRRNAGEDIPTGVLMAALFYDLFNMPDAEPGVNSSPHEAFISARDIFHSIAAKLHLPRRESDRVCNIVSRRNYFTDGNDRKRNSSFENRFIRNEHFKDTLMFYEILSEVNGGYSAKVSYWKKLAEGLSSETEKKPQGGRDDRRRTPGPVKNGIKTAVPDVSAAGAKEGAAETVVKKKSRNRKYRGRSDKKKSELTPEPEKKD